MATSQGFANWICGEHLNPHFLKYLFLCEHRALDRFASGATIQTIYYPDIKAFHICLPTLLEQKRIVAILDEAFAAIATATANTEKSLANARELFESGLNRVFSEKGEGWVEVELGEVVDISHGYAFKGSTFGKTNEESKPIVLTPGNYTENATLEFNGKNTPRRAQ